MSLDPPMSDAEIIAEAQRRRSRAVLSKRETTVGTAPAAVQWAGVGPVALGPDSPLRSTAVRRAPRVDREHPIQVDVVAWADDPATLPQFPELKALYAVPNQAGAGGKRNARQQQIEGTRLKAEGKRTGMPDLVLPTPRRAPDGRVYGALYVEMKDESGAVRRSQRERIAMLRAAGNCCEVAMSADAAKAIVTHYLMLPRP